MSLIDRWYAYRARNGDHKAFDVLFKNNAPRIFNLLRRFGTSVAEAEDLSQETFLTAYRSLSAWQGKGAFSTWLCGIAVNTYRSHRRKTGREPEEALLDDTEIAETDSDPLACYTRAEASYTLQIAIAELPDGCREAFVLVYVEQFEYREAAELLGVPTGTIQSRLNRAKRLLHSRLTDLAPADRAEETPTKGANIHVL